MCYNSTSFINSSDCNETVPLVKEPSFSKVYRLVTTILFSAILVASLAGNSLVVFTILRQKNMLVNNTFLNYKFITEDKK